jgi:hypothetical protein
MTMRRLLTLLLPLVVLSGCRLFGLAPIPCTEDECPAGMSCVEGACRFGDAPPPPPDDGGDPPPPDDGGDPPPPPPEDGGEPAEDAGPPDDGGDPPPPDDAGQPNDDGGVVVAVPPGAGDLVITEISPGTTALPASEWIELRNTTSSLLDLDGVQVRNDALGVIALTGELAAGAALVVGAAADEAGAAPDQTYASPELGASGRLTIERNSAELDAVDYGPDLGLPVEGSSWQLNPGGDGSDPFDWCLGTGAYGGAGHLGSPRAANAACPTFDVVTTPQLQDATDIAPASDGDLVEVRGLRVTFLGGTDIFVQDPNITGAFSGVRVVAPDVSGLAARGDEVTVRGTYRDDGTLGTHLELERIVTTTINAGVPAAVAINTATVDPDLEGVLVTVGGFKGVFNTSTGGTRLTLDAGAGFTLGSLAVGQLHFTPSPAVGDFTFFRDITGVVAVSEGALRVQMRDSGDLDRLVAVRDDESTCPALTPQASGVLNQPFPVGDVCNAGFTFNGSCYAIVIGLNQNFREARSFCHNSGGHLAVITTQAEEDAINAQINGQGLYWIGTCDDPNEGTFRWVNGEAFSFESFSGAPPANAGNDCVESNEFGWFDDVCTNTGNFLCEWTYVAP